MRECGEQMWLWSMKAMRHVVWLLLFSMVWMLAFYSYYEDYYIYRIPQPREAPFQSNTPVQVNRQEDGSVPVTPGPCSYSETENQGRAAQPSRRIVFVKDRSRRSPVSPGQSRKPDVFTYSQQQKRKHNIVPTSNEERDLLESIRRYTDQLPETTEVTVVTAYFNLGALNKVSSQGPYTPDLYKKWMSVFEYLDNPLIVFTDSNTTAAYFSRLRARHAPNRTQIYVLRRQDLWAFQLEAEIQAVFSQPEYPSHSPNTINPLYSCAMHAKFELVGKVVCERLYQTRFVAWLDIGLFREEVGREKRIHLTVPRDFKQSRVGYSEVNEFEAMTPEEVIRRNKVWVGGASFLAAPEVAYAFCSDYRKAVRRLLDMGWMSTDQQVIYSMFQDSFNFTRRFQLHVFTRRISNSWFDMGYLMKEAP